MKNVIFPQTIKDTEDFRQYLSFLLHKRVTNFSYDVISSYLKGGFKEELTDLGGSGEDELSTRLIKALYPLGMTEYMDGQIMKMYPGDRDCQFFKYSVSDAGKVYMYDNYISKDNQRLVGVSEINGVNIDEVIRKIKGYFGDEQMSNISIANIMMHPEIMKTIGITNENYFVTLMDNDKEIKISLTSEDEPRYDMFYKPHDKATLLSDMSVIGEEVTNEYDLNLYSKYAIDSSSKLLKLLSEFSLEIDDQDFFKRLYESQIREYGIGSINDESLDWMILSSSLLFKEKELDRLPDYVFDEVLSKYLNGTKFLDEFGNYVGDASRPFYRNIMSIKDYRRSNEIDEDERKWLDDLERQGVKNVTFSNEIGCNESLLNTDGTINYKNLTKSVRNAFAHSRYEIIDDNYIRVFRDDPDTGKTISNMIIGRNFVEKMIRELSTFDNLGNAFPLVTMSSNVKDVPFTQQTNTPMSSYKDIVEYLLSRRIINIEDLKYKEVNGKRIVDTKDTNEFESACLVFKDKYPASFLFNSWKDKIASSFRNTLGKYVDGTITESKVENMEEVISQVKKYGDDFFKHSFVNQTIILNEIVRGRELAQRGLSDIFSDVISSTSKSKGGLINSLNKTPTSYVSIDKYMQLSVISYLNSMLLYGYNDNEKIDVSSMDFSSMDVDKDILEKRHILESENLRRSNKNLEKNLGTKKKKIDSFKKSKEHFDFKGIESEYSRSLPSIIESMEKDYAESVLEADTKKRINDEAIMASMAEVINIRSGNINGTIVHHLRNSLAHGNVSFTSSFDFRNVLDNEIKFEDYDPVEEDKLTFSASIKVGELVKQLNDSKYKRSVFKVYSTDTKEQEESFKH